MTDLQYLNYLEELAIANGGMRITGRIDAASGEPVVSVRTSTEHTQANTLREAIEILHDSN